MMNDGRNQHRASQITKIVIRQGFLIRTSKMSHNDMISVDIEDSPKHTALPSTKEGVSQFSVTEFILSCFGKGRRTDRKLPQDTVQCIQPGKSPHDRSPGDPVRDFILVSHGFRSQLNAETHAIRCNRVRVSRIARSASSNRPASTSASPRFRDCRLCSSSCAEGRDAHQCWKRSSRDKPDVASRDCSTTNRRNASTCSMTVLMA